jgi:CubicO group peptidase (beta-lactamase class C family)
MMATIRDVHAFEPLRDRMAALVRDDGVGGLAWAVSVGDDVVVDGAAGWLDPERRERPMPTDAIFRIASVSKPIVAVAALQLVERELIGLDDPIDAVLPELAHRRVLVDPIGPLDQPTVPADRALTLRDLLTFRCGLGMDFDFTQPQPVLDAMWAAGVGPGPTAPDCDPDEFLARLGALPLIEQPGSRWRYHTGSDIVSVLIERLRREPLDEVLARDVCAPLGMVDTAFWVDVDRRDRFGACRMWNDDGALAVWDEPDGRWSSSPSFRSGAAGLVSTVADLVAFGRMLLAGGAAPGGRVLDADTVRVLTTDQLTDHQRITARVDGHGDAQGWGLGLAVQHRAAAGGWPGVGAYGWDGGLGARWLVDPAHDLCAVLLTTDAFATSDAPAALVAFVESIATIIGRPS